MISHYTQLAKEVSETKKTYSNIFMIASQVVCKRTKIPNKKIIFVNIKIKVQNSISSRGNK